MPRVPRAESVTGFYHVTMRGAGRRSIFESDYDRTHFIEVIGKTCNDAEVEIHAWCLMENHAHLLVRAELEAISNAMQRFETAYSHYFNGKYSHVGPVFQSRYGSEAIDSEEHLLMTLCYIHQNPIRAGLSKGYEVPWSSYSEYLGRVGRKKLTTTSFMLDLLGGVDGFVAFHDSEMGLVQVSLGATHPRIDDASARMIAKRLFGPQYATSLALLPKPQRDKAIRTLRSHGISVRQIERLTGIGRSIVARA